MDKEELKLLQSYPLELKEKKSMARIQEAIYKYCFDGLYVSVSGGKDSLVLQHLVDRVNPNIIKVGCDTGLEYPSVRENMYKLCDIIIKPDMNFKEVLTKYGYPIISKEQSQFIYQYRNAKSEKTKATRWYGNKWGRGKISEKWKYILARDIKVSDKCCDVMKKKPFKKFEKETGKIPILGKMAIESSKRTQDYIKQGGCNAFNNKRPKCEPLGFWTEQDILQYILKYNLTNLLPEEYGEIMEVDGVLKTTKLNRTGCMFCMYGLHLEQNNRFDYMKEKHPKIYDYCMRGGKYDDEGWWIPDKGLGMKKVIKHYLNKEIE